METPHPLWQQVEAAYARHLETYQALEVDRSPWGSPVREQLYQEMDVAAERYIELVLRWLEEGSPRTLDDPST